MTRPSPPVIEATLQDGDVLISWVDDLANTDGYKLWFGTNTPYQLTTESAWVTLPAGATSYRHESIFPNGRARKLFYVMRGVSDCVGESADSTIYAVIGRGFSPEIDLAPQSIFNHTPISGTVPYTMTFNNQSQNGERYLWSFGDGITSTEIMPTHIYTRAGSYTVSLITYGHGEQSDEMVVADMVTMSRLAYTFPLNINFQPESAPISSGYIVDGGVSFAPRSSGYSYGWNQGISSYTRDRNSAASPNQAYDTLIAPQHPSGMDGIWEIELPNGAYEVRVVAGDPSYDEYNYNLLVEGTEIVSGTTNSSNLWLEGTSTIDVTDGRLTLTNGDSATYQRLNFIEIKQAPLSIYYVDSIGAGNNSCDSWTNTCNLQVALSLASSGAEIWAKEGVYLPGSDENDTFNLTDGLALYGGFSGTETLRTQRDPAVYTTVLSGDIDGDDTTNGAGVIEDTAKIFGTNSRHVVTVGSDVASALLDGFVVTGGQATSPWGGGIRSDGSFTIQNSTVSGNQGSGVSVSNGELNAENVIFKNNTNLTSGQQGGALQFSNADSDFSHVSLVGNTAYKGGGAIYLNGGTHSFADVTLTDNEATTGNGGAIYALSATLTGTDMVVSRNIVTSNGPATGYGGAISSEHSTLSFTDTVFSENSAIIGGTINLTPSTLDLYRVTFLNNTAELGGALHMHAWQSFVHSENSLYLGNSALHGAAFFSSYSYNLVHTSVGDTYAHNSSDNSGLIYYKQSSTGTFTNAIIWGNDVADAPLFGQARGARPTISHSLIQGSGGSANWNSSLGATDGGNNLDIDPLFTDADGADNVAGTADDDLTLSSGSPAIDTGSSTTCPTTDLAGNIRPQDGDDDGSAVCDMGAFEHMNAIASP